MEGLRNGEALRELLGRVNERLKRRYNVVLTGEEVVEGYYPSSFVLLPEIHTARHLTYVPLATLTVEALRDGKRVLVGVEALNTQLEKTRGIFEKSPASKLLNMGADPLKVLERVLQNPERYVPRTGAPRPEEAFWAVLLHLLKRLEGCGVKLIHPEDEELLRRHKEIVLKKLRLHTLPEEERRRVLQEDRELLRERTEAMVKNLLREAEKFGPDIAVLVAGARHLPTRKDIRVSVASGDVRSAAALRENRALVRAIVKEGLGRSPVFLEVVPVQGGFIGKLLKGLMRK